MKHLILFLSLLVGSVLTHAAQTGERCGNTTPSFCVDETVAISGYPGAIVTAVMSNGNYAVSGAYNSEYPPSLMGKTKGCGTTTPRFCMNEDIVISGYPNSRVIGINLTSGNYYVSGAYNREYPVNLMGKTKGCGTTTPRFCAGEPVVISGYPNSLIIGVNLVTGTYYVSGAYNREYPANLIGKTRSTNPNSPESLNVMMSTDTQDIVQTYQALASVTTKDRSAFLTASSAYLTQMNSEDVNIMAGMVVSKIIRLSTSQVVKDNFDKPALAFIQGLEKSNWKSLDQIEANVRTLDFATRVIFAAVKLKLNLANSTLQDNADLAELGRIAATTQLSKKILSLQNFCESHRMIVDELIQDPRHGVLGMTTADIMGWVLSK